jgi:predicted O-methyltransferase YrrM
MADDPRWAAVDEYFDGLLTAGDDALEAALVGSQAAGLPDIQVSATQGKFLMLLARILGARKILEIGTLGGYSTIWLARGLAEGGRLTTLEVHPVYARVARQNLDRAGLADLVDVRVGIALRTLPTLETEGDGPYDLVFIDADKRSNRAYVEWALRMSHPGTVIIVDNVVRGGQVVDETSEDPDVRGVRDLARMLAEDPRLDATAIQTVGGKGYDGFALAVVE